MKLRKFPNSVFNLILVILLVLAAWLQITTSSAPFAPKLFGDKTVSVFDLWFFGHFMSGVIFSGIWIRVTGETINHDWWRQRWFSLTVRSFAVWELSEFIAELGYFGAAIAHWKAGLEHWSNRYLGDAVMDLAGVYIFRKFPKIFWSTLIIGIIWETANVLSPTAMTIQNTILNWF